MIWAVGGLIQAALSTANADRAHLEDLLRAEQNARRQVLDVLSEKEELVKSLSKQVANRNLDLSNAERQLQERDRQIYDLETSAANYAAKDAKYALDDAIKREFNIWVLGERKYYVSSAEAAAAWERALWKAEAEAPIEMMRQYDMKQYADIHAKWDNSGLALTPIEPIIELLGVCVCCLHSPTY